MSTPAAPRDQSSAQLLTYVPQMFVAGKKNDAPVAPCYDRGCPRTGSRQPFLALYTSKCGQVIICIRPVNLDPLLPLAEYLIAYQISLSMRNIAIDHARYHFSFKRVVVRTVPSSAQVSLMRQSGD